MWTQALICKIYWRGRTDCISWQCGAIHFNGLWQRGDRTVVCLVQGRHFKEIGRFNYLLADTTRNKTIAIVESEKTAIIATHFMSDFVWLAAGGMNWCFNKDAVILEDNATDEQKTNGLDIADFLLMTETPQMALQRLIKRHPPLQHQIDCIGLVLVEES